MNRRNFLSKALRWIGAVATMPLIASRVRDNRWPIAPFHWTHDGQPAVRIVRARDFGFLIPDDAVIEGVKVEYCGAHSDLWGTELTKADVESANFGVVIRAIYMVPAS